MIILFVNCSEKKEIEHLEVNYKNGQAISVEFKASQGIEEAEIFIAGASTTPVLGEVKQLENGYQFIPVVPFSKGQSYEIRGNGVTLANFMVAPPLTKELGELAVIYPTRDTVPENLLKIYLQFSQPMQQVGEALNFIKVTDETIGEEIVVFLELESELWNKAHDRLTLWLDPGRIKTDLIPNKEKGLPILQGREYTIHISRDWKTAEGQSLKKDYTKKLVVIARDSNKPNPDNWEILPPAAGEKGQLQIIFEEPMDAVLALEALTIKDANGQLVPGDFVLGRYEKRILFKPVNNWNKEEYKILIEAKLEDNAGNNLNRLFDTDVLQNQGRALAQKSYELAFRITD
ncbi:Ig-like domain-containing protein [Muriicola sp. Z0-33]|uniref:Ig-like domain-containing protein n=1 Tax=Muriicola sp. Z0-33 TaxID=2816957 RepID=UPI00223756F8|nr:Ig-like domain-containing protein [Muriicola sp. Z0-33]